MLTSKRHVGHVQMVRDHPEHGEEAHAVERGDLTFLKLSDFKYFPVL